MDLEQLGEELMKDSLEENDNYARFVDTEESEPIGRLDFEKAKAFLSTTDQRQNISMYDHLADVIKTILRSKIPNAVDKLEEISSDVKKTRQKPESDLTEVFEIPEELQAFVKEKQIFYKFKPAVPEADKVIATADEENGDSDDDEEEADAVGVDSSEVLVEEPNLSEVLPDIYYIMSRFNEAGIGLSPMEVFELTVALKELAIQFKLKKVNFWGKMLGIKNDYYIAEAPYQDGIVQENFGWEDPAKVKKSEEALEEKDKDEGEEDAEDDKVDEEPEDDNVDEEPEDDKVDEEPEKKAGEVKEDDDKVEEESEKEENGENEEDETREEESENVEDEEEEEAPKQLPISEPKEKTKKRIPAEKKGTGVNEYLYFVCTKLGEPWTVLPFMLPLHISEARYIKRFFTGDLQLPIKGVPYPGKEAHLLRAQIARITATTYIAPVGFYKSAAEKDEDDEDDDNDDEEKDAYEIVFNPKFEPKSIKCLFSEDVEGWCHCRKAILYQGRCIPMKLGEKDEDEEEPDDEDEAEKENEEESKDEDEDEEETKEEEDPEILEAVAETQVPVLTSLTEDNGIGKVKPWTMKLSSKLVEEKAILIIYSNIWPGAYTFYDGKNFEHIYFGYGFKYSVTPYAPPKQAEHEVDEEVLLKEETEDSQDDEEGENGENEDENEEVGKEEELEED